MKVIEGNILDSVETFICHQTNCVTNFAGGLAATLFDEMPWADCYKERNDDDGVSEPGTTDIRGDGKGERYVINMMGQFYPGSPRFAHSAKDGYKARENFFKSCLMDLECVALAKPEATFAFPWQIGCGLAGGDWESYKSMLEDFAELIGEERVVIYRYNPSRKI